MFPFNNPAFFRKSTNKIQNKARKTRRNDPCWCGSGKKYKKCHLNEDLDKSGRESVSRPPVIRRSEEYVEGMMRSCRLAKSTLEMVGRRIAPGITTNMINDWVHQFILDRGAVPAPLNYKGFPKSVCTSVNEVICHGIPDETALKEGDIVNVDVTCELNGYFGDTSKTFMIGECSEEAGKITSVAKECLKAGIKATEPYGYIGDIGAAIQKYARSMNCSVVEKFVGHGIGTAFHQEPQVPHYGKRGDGPLILPGMFFTIEPMINLGKKGVIILDDGWTAVTTDGRLSAQFEHTLFVSENGVEVLTA